MSEIIILIGFVLGAWLVHSTLVGVYVKKFSSEKNYSFRAVHALEIFLTTFIAILIYQKWFNPELSVGTGIITVILTLAVVDGVLLSLYKPLRKRFDAGHFLLAYAVVALSIWLALSLT